MDEQKEYKLVKDYFKELKTERNKYITRWRDIQNYVSITNEINSEFEDNKQPYEQKDIYINDPTGFTCVNQAGDYLAGILWNSDAITLEPSEYIKKKANGQDLSKFYKKSTNTTLEQINATDAGFISVLRSHSYDQFSFATSGIGTFRSKEFDNAQSECCLSFKPYGVWNTAIDEGSNNRIDVVFCVYNWRLNQVIEEFCMTDNEFDEEKFAKLPQEIQKAYEGDRFNDKFKIVCGILPNKTYSLNTRGINGAKYKGYWFLDDGKSDVFHTDYFKTLPIAMCRAIKVNNQVYGESSGSLAISAIKMLNHIAGDTVDNIEKTTDAPLGVLSGALVAGNVINRSAGEITTFNAQATPNGQAPIFPISQAGDISAVVNFLIPELKKDITNIFKIDQLLDFNNQTQMTATESSFRMSIRGKSINGLLTQQKVECIEPTMHRAISIIADCGLYGYDLAELPERTEEEIMFKQKVIQDEDYIPEVVAEAMRNNKIWYKLKFNGELEKLSNAEIYEAIGRFLQYLNAVLQIKPELVHALNDYEFLDLLKSVSNLVNDKLIKTKTEYDDIIKKLEQAQAEQQEMQAQLAKAQYLNAMGSADKNANEAKQIATMG